MREALKYYVYLFQTLVAHVCLCMPEYKSIINYIYLKFSPIRKFFESSLDLGYILPLLQLLLGILNLN